MKDNTDPKGPIKDSTEPKGSIKDSQNKVSRNK